MKNLTTILFFLFLFVSSHAQEFISDHIIIQTRSKTSIDILKKENQQVAQNLSSVRSIFEKGNIYLLKVSDKALLSATIAQLKRIPSVIHVSKDYLTKSRNTTPNDEFYSQQDGLEIINAPEFWDKTTGGTNVKGEDIVVAIIDDGYDQVHEDLIENLWLNPGEIAGDNIDNDNNGFIDDVVGVNITAESDVHIKESHGTAVAGIIGAKGDNNKGISGINWNVKLMLLSTSGSVSHIIEAYGYVEAQRALYNQTNGAEGAFIVASNSSFGIDNEMASDFPIWCGMYDSMGEVGILSAVSTSNASKDVDETGDMPSTCTSPYVIAVTSTDFADVVQGAYGETSIDIAAPGDEMTSCALNNEYSTFGGTSAAAPMVAGGIALMYSLNLNIFANNDDPSLKALTIKNAILNSSRKVVGLDGSIVTSGVLDLQQACIEISENATPVNLVSFNSLFPNPSNETVTLEFNIPLNESYEILVHNMLGQLVHIEVKQNDISSEEVYFLEIEDWAQGQYAITIKTEEEEQSMQFVKY